MLPEAAGTPAPRCTSTAAARGPCATASLWFAAWADQRLYRLDVGAGHDGARSRSRPSPLEPRAPALRRRRPQPGRRVAGRACASATTRRRRRGGQRDRRAAGVAGEDVGEPVEPVVLVTGPDFVSSPRLSPDGAAAGVDPVGPPGHAVGRHRAALGAVRPRAAAPVDGASGWPAARTSRSSSPSGPPTAACSSSSDRTGWWNVYRFTGGRPRARRRPRRSRRSTPRSAARTGCSASRWFAVLPDDTPGRVARRRRPDQAVGVVAPGTAPGRAARHAVHRRRPAARPVGDAEFAMVAAGADRRGRPPLRCRFAGRGRRSRPRCSGRPRPRARPGVVLGRPSRSRSRPAGGRTAHALLYPPTNPDVVGAARRAPPLLVMSHGGPTVGGPADPQPRHPVLDQPGLRGGRRQLRRHHRLRPAVPRAARTARGASSTSRTASPRPAPGRRGRSSTASAWPSGAAAPAATRRCARWPSTTRSRAGASHYGVADLEALARDTHKFESRYLDGLVGPYPEARSTSTASARRSTTPTASTCPLIVFQGLEDEVVPPARPR